MEAAREAAAQLADLARRLDALEARHRDDDVSADDALYAALFGGA